MLVTRGDFMMPSPALVAARLSARCGLGAFGETLFVNTIVDPKKQDGRVVVVYYDADDDKRDGGAVRTLNSSPAWYVEKIILSSCAPDTATSRDLLRKHVNFLCSIRNQPVYYDEDQTWYRFLHISMIGRPRRPGRSVSGMELYEVDLRVQWRPLSAKDVEYESITGITSET